MRVRLFWVLCHKNEALGTGLRACGLFLWPTWGLLLHSCSNTGFPAENTPLARWLLSVHLSRWHWNRQHRVIHLWENPAVLTVLLGKIFPKSSQKLIKYSFITGKWKRRAFAGGIYRLLLDSLSCKMLFWTNILLGRLVLFLFPSHFYFSFSVWLSAVFLDNSKHLFSFYIYQIVAVYVPRQLNSVLYVRMISYITLFLLGFHGTVFYIWQVLTFYFRGTTVCELTFITNKCLSHRIFPLFFFFLYFHHRMCFNGYTSLSVDVSS